MSNLIPGFTAIYINSINADNFLPENNKKRADKHPLIDSEYSLQNYDFIMHQMI